MFDYNFNRSASFLEQLICENLDNKELIASYTELLKLKSTFDKGLVEANVKNFDTNSKSIESFNKNINEQNIKAMDVNKSMNDNIHELNMNSNDRN